MNRHRGDRPFNGIGPAMAQQQPVMNLAQPMNDIQLIGLMAAMASQGKAVPADAVAWAKEALVEACVTCNGDELAKAIRARVERDSQQKLIHG